MWQDLCSVLFYDFFCRVFAATTALLYYPTAREIYLRNTKNPAKNNKLIWLHTWRATIIQHLLDSRWLLAFASYFYLDVSYIWSVSTRVLHTRSSGLKWTVRQRALTSQSILLITVSMLGIDIHYLIYVLLISLCGKWRYFALHQL